MSVHYKFKSALDYDTVTFDGLHISVGELKNAISHQKRIGKTSDFDLQITNAQTKEVYSDDHTLIPKNTSLLVARVPLAQQPKKPWHGDSTGAVKHKDVGHSKGAADLSRMEGTEQDKIDAMISQSTLDYDPSNYQKIRGQSQRGEVPPTYRCYRCNKPGHWIKNCPIVAIAGAQGAESLEIRRSTGIPLSFMVPVDGPKAPGAMMTPTGSFAVPVVDHEAYIASETGAPASEAVADTGREIPDDLICSLCRDLLTDAVMIPCCGNSFCDECIRTVLLDSEEHECPDCREKEIAPTTLIPNRFLRNSVSSFRNQTGYSRRMPHRQPVAPPPQPAPLQLPPEIPQASTQQPSNGQLQLIQPIQPFIGGEPTAPGPAVGGGGGGGGEESDGSYEDNITVTVPPPSNVYSRHSHHTSRPHRSSRPHSSRYGLPHSGKPHERDMPPGGPPMSRGLEEQRASTPTVDENRDPLNPQMFQRPPMYGPGSGPGPGPGPGAGPPPHFSGGFPRDRPPPGYPREPFPPEVYRQPPPPGIKESPTLRHGEDPLEAFNRMIREKEERAKARERRRLHSPSSRSPPPRSPPPRSPAARSPPPRSPPPRSPPARLRSRTRSPPLRLRSPPSRGSSRIRYSRSRSGSPRRRRSPPWSPRRRRSRDRTLSLTRSPSPRRRRSPPRYRSPLRASPPSRPHRQVLRTPPPVSPQHHRFGPGFEERVSPHRRNVEPPFGSRYGPRSNGPPPSYPPMGVKPIPPINEIPMIKEPSPVFRGRYEEPPFEDIPPGAEPPVPGYEPPPFDNPMVPPVMVNHDRLPPINFREPVFHRGPFNDAPQPYRDMPPVPRDQPLPPYREGFRGPMQPPPFRDPGLPPVQFRDGPPYRDQVMPPQQFRDGNPNPNYRGGPPPGFRDNGPFRNNMPPYRDGPPPGYRDNQPPLGFRDGPPSFRPSNIRETMPGPMIYPDPNREGFREIPPLLPDGQVGRDQRGYRQPRNTRGGPRRNFDERRDRERPDREPRDRYDRDNSEKTREDRKMRDQGRDERNREYDRNREVLDKERDREERGTPDRKRKASTERTPPRRRTEGKEKRKSESRGHSKEKDGRRDKKDDKESDRNTEKGREKEQKEKERKVKDRKKKKKEKEEKKKKKEKRERREKEESREEEPEKENELPTIKEEPRAEQEPEQYNSKPMEELIKKEPEVEKPKIDNDLYGDVGVADIDKEIMETYIKTEPDNVIKTDEVDEPAEAQKEDKDSSFEGLELQAPIDDPDLKADETEKEMLAPIPELSKWEVDEESALDKSKESREPGEISPENEYPGKVTSEVIKRAENAIFAKAINSIKTIEIKKISNDRLKLYADGSGDRKESPMNNIQITVPVTNIEQRSNEINNERKLKRSKTPPQKLSIKERLGGKIEEPGRGLDERFVHSTVERIKSRSKTPKRDHPYRRVTVDTREHSRRTLGKPDETDPHRYEVRREDRRITSEAILRTDHARHRDRSEKTEALRDSERHRSPTKEKTKKKEHKLKKSKEGRRDEHTHSHVKAESKNEEVEKPASRFPERDRKRSLLDEANFEPDYDEHLETDTEGKEDAFKKRDKSKTPVNSADNSAKKSKTIEELIAKKPGETSDSSSDSDSSSSSSSSEVRKKKRKKKKSKRKKKKVASDSDSESDGSSSDEPKKKKKKSKHKKKSSKKKKKKSKHK